ncbi:GntR family transcriptional regulator [Streptomyces carpaticus]|uniref:GntR family transcriptional regulator n=1 Tax=Streptomyces carpaticus TaxID=285558 RepID=A0ABV4ZQY7_9ACTN
MSDGPWVHESAPYVQPRGKRDTWSQEAASRGHSGTQRIVRAGETTAPAEVAEALGLTAGTTVVERCREILLDGRAVELTRTYFPVGIARGTALATTRKIRGGVVALLADLGHAPHVVREEVHARMPDAHERATLELGPSEPVLHLLRHTLDRDGLLFQVDVSVFAASTQRLRYEMRVG